jgi:hypothetical protein
MQLSPEFVLLVTYICVAFADPIIVRKGYLKHINNLPLSK